MEKNKNFGILGFFLMLFFIVLLFSGCASAYNESAAIEGDNTIYISLVVGMVILFLGLWYPYNQGYFLRIQKEQTGDEVKKEDPANLAKIFREAKKYCYAVGGELGGQSWTTPETREEIKKAIKRGVKIEIAFGNSIYASTKKMFEEEGWLKNKQITLYFLSKRENIHFRVSDDRNVLVHRDKGVRGTWIDGVVAFGNAELAERFREKFQEIKAKGERIDNFDKFNKENVIQDNNSYNN